MSGQTETEKKLEVHPLSELSLRDSFALAALKGLLAAGTLGFHGHEEIANMAYTSADAMLKRRRL